MNRNRIDKARGKAMATELCWEYTALTIPALVSPALDDIGVDDPEVRQAARHFALAHLKELEEALGPMTMEELQHGLAYFIERYEQRLRDSKECA